MIRAARFGCAPILFFLLTCSAPSPQTAPPQAVAQQAIAPSVEIARLRDALAQAVAQRDACAQADQAAWAAPAKAALDMAGVPTDRPQLIVVVDRAPARQQLCLLVATPDPAWQVIGGSKVSTGQAGRHGYFITPTGVFPHTDAILDYRALGTFNENHIRGLGLKGSRVWDFGWQQAEKGWLPDHETGEMRLLLHATDPDYLEQRLGRPASQGCVRIPAAMNRFLDHHGVLDADYLRAATTDPRYAAVLPPDQDPSPLAGTLLVIIDTSAPPGSAR